jgi:hypothetical protein
MSTDDRDSEFQSLTDQARRLPRSIEPPRDLWPGIRGRIRAGDRATSPARRWVSLAVAATLLAVVAYHLVPRPAGSAVERQAGRPVVGTAPMGDAGWVRVGQWIVTDDSSSAVVQVGRIGWVEVKPGSRVQLVAAQDSNHRFALARGAIYARVDAPPRLFFVETPSGTAVDLGCAYTLEVDSLGNSVLQVTAGYVELQGREGGRRTIVPLGAIAETRASLGPGMPYTADAPAALRNALRAFDFAAGGPAAVRAALAAARSEDALSLWHLLARVDPGQRAAVYDRLAALLPPPSGVTRRAALRLEPDALDAYWTKIRRIAWRREILKGVKAIDPRTGVAPP